MSHTYTSILFHVVFSRKERQPTIVEPAKLWAYLAGVARNLNYEALAIGGTQNHVHLLVRLPSDVSVSEGSAEGEIQFVALASRKRPVVRMATRLRGLLGERIERRCAVSGNYIQNQAEHHRRRSFQEELVVLLDKSGIAFYWAVIFG